jgi:heat shock protein HslJ
MHRITSIAVVAATLVACSLLPASGFDGAWRLSAGTVDGQEIAVPANPPMTLTLAGSEVGGSGGCNSFGGSVAVTGDQVDFGDLASTLIGCDEPLARGEQIYLTALGRVERGARDGASLTLRGTGVELRFTAIAPTPAAALIGTRWQLESIITGDAAMSAIGIEQATLLFGDGGTVAGSTGCRDFAVAFSGDARRTSIDPVRIATGDCSGPSMTIEQAVLATLADGATAHVEQDRLIVDGTAGRRLEYRAGQAGAASPEA